MAFFIYEEYSLRYNEVVNTPHRPLHPQFSRGVEALTGALNSWDNRGEYGKRALELSDMLCKVDMVMLEYLRNES